MAARKIVLADPSLRHGRLDHEANEAVEATVKSETTIVKCVILL